MYQCDIKNFVNVCSTVSNSVHNLTLVFGPVNDFLILQNYICHQKISNRLSFRICAKTEDRVYLSTKRVLGSYLHYHSGQMI
jgi:hypothetical protein